MKKLLVSLIMFINCPIISQNIICMDIEENPNADQMAFSEFSKYVRVLDCFSIYAEASISDEKVLHAAAICAEILDNNEDGQVDDQEVKSRLFSQKALIPIFNFEGSYAEDLFFDYYNGQGVSAVLYNNEINPYQPGYWGEDASVEEIIHTINHVGHTYLYPDAFSLSPNSSLLSSAMDLARSGQFIDVPNNYPPSAWYHYDDYTCDYECMAIEYLYWAIVTKMGILNNLQTCAEIVNEWELCSAELLESMDPSIYALITDPQYRLPLEAPDGNYCPDGLYTENLNSIESKIYPNPCRKFFQYTCEDIQEVCLTDLSGNLIIKKIVEKGINKIDCTILDSGCYFFKTNKGFNKIMIN